MSNEGRVQLIYAFEEANKLMPGIYTDDIIKRFKEESISIERLETFLNIVNEKIRFMRKLQKIIREQEQSKSRADAIKILGNRKLLNPLYHNGKLRGPPYQSFDGVFIVDEQVSARCGLHAINNLLQLKNPKCFATVDSCKLGVVLKGDRASDGDYLQSQQIVALINGEPIGQQGKRERKKFGTFLNGNYHASFLNPDYNYDRLIEMDRVHNDKSLIGIIEKEPGHYVAWLLKENEGLKYWYQINSFGSITRYPYGEGIEKLKSRLKVSLVGASYVYEHIVVYGGVDLGRDDCFDLKLPERYEVEDLGLSVATGGSKNKRTKKARKKRIKRTKKNKK